MLVASTRPPIPWANLTISFAKNLLQTSLRFSRRINCRNFKSSPVSPPETASMYSTRNCKRKPREHVFLAMNFVEELDRSIMLMAASCVTDLIAQWDRVFLASASSFWEIIFGAREACCLTSNGSSERPNGTNASKNRYHNGKLGQWRTQRWRRQRRWRQ